MPVVEVISSNLVQITFIAFIKIPYIHNNQRIFPTILFFSNRES